MFNLEDYETVEERLIKFWKDYPDGQIHTKLLDQSAGRFIVEAAIYRTEADIRPWFVGMKFNIDIGKTSPDGKLDSSTSCFVDAVDFAAYLKSVVNGNAVFNYPANERNGTTHPESFVSYGGAIINNQPVSRILKIQYWTSNDVVDTSAFIWKAGHFLLTIHSLTDILLFSLQKYTQTIHSIALFQVVKHLGKDRFIHSAYYCVP